MASQGWTFDVLIQLETQSNLPKQVIFTIAAGGGEGLC